MGQWPLNWREKRIESRSKTTHSSCERSPQLTRKQASSTLPSKLPKAHRNWRMLRGNMALLFRFRKRPIFTASTCHFAIKPCGMRNKFSDCALVAAICAAFVALVWFVFGQTTKFPFVNFDDPEYVYEVPQINAGLTWHGIKWAFTHWPATNWFPLKNISLMLDFQFYGFDPGAFHFTNVVLHAAVVVLLFLVLRQMSPSRTGTIWRAAFVAALFAIHPLRAESVVWIEERKDVLSGLFFMLTLAAYLHYTRKPSLARYLTMSILFAAGLLSKPMLVTTPFILLLLDYWPLNRSQKSEIGDQKI